MIDKIADNLPFLLYIAGAVVATYPFWPAISNAVSAIASKLSATKTDSEALEPILDEPAANPLQANAKLLAKHLASEGHANESRYVERRILPLLESAE